METYDDRPISVYDNMNTSPPPSTPKVKHHQLVVPSSSSSSSSSARAATAASAANGTAQSPYTDISFKFNDNTQKQKPHQQDEQSLPNGNRNMYRNSQQHLQQQPHQSLQTTNQVRTTNTSYAIPFNTQSTTTITAAAAAAALTPSSTSTSSLTNKTAVTIVTATPTATNASRAQARPLSQHSQSELNESSQSVAAVKAALNDAKSKFFGLNGHTHDNNSATANDSQHKLLPQQHSEVNKPISSSAVTPPTATHQVQIQIKAPTPPPKSQPKYQNIPENSAVFRQQPPELPPKPNIIPAVTAAAAPSSLILMNINNNNNNNTPEESNMPTLPTSPSTSTSTAIMQSPMTPAANSLPYAAFQQIPLSDIDSSQPSQAVYMTTTVPQNIKGTKIAGRHTPTRNSLRHSRMLVVNNNSYQGIQHPNPMHFKYPNLARWLLILKIIVGIAITFLAIWISFLAPNAAIQDNPYWSGLALLLAGILGLVLVRYQRIKRHKVRENCFIFLRADLYVLSILAILLCGVALICAAIHYARLTASDTKCVATNVLLEHGSCTCTFNTVTDAPVTRNITETYSNGLLDEEEHVDDVSYKVEYRDFSCKEIHGEWIYILGLSIIFNSVGFLLSLIFAISLVCCRHNSKRFYTSVHTSTF